MTAAKWVYRFGGGNAEGDAEMRNLLGGKGANLAEMSNLGLPVPPGFTITTEVCTEFYAHGRAAIRRARGAGRAPRCATIEAAGRRAASATPTTAARLGALGRARLDARHDGHRPQPRPQRRDREGLRERRAIARFAYDSYRRFIQMYSDVVLGRRARTHFEDILERRQGSQGVDLDTELSRGLAEARRRLSRPRSQSEPGKPFPQDVARAAVGRDRRRVRLAGSSRAPSPIAGCTTSRRTGARPSTCRRWCSATWARPRPPASPSPATLDRRERALRRIPGQRPGRGRRRRASARRSLTEAARERRRADAALAGGG